MPFSGKKGIIVSLVTNFLQALPRHTRAMQVCVNSASLLFAVSRMNPKLFTAKSVNAVFMAKLATVVTSNEVHRHCVNTAQCANRLKPARFALEI